MVYFGTFWYALSHNLVTVMFFDRIFYRLSSTSWQWQNHHQFDPNSFLTNLCRKNLFEGGRGNLLNLYIKMVQEITLVSPKNSCNRATRHNFTLPFLKEFIKISSLQCFDDEHQIYLNNYECKQ